MEFFEFVDFSEFTAGGRPAFALSVFSRRAKAHVIALGILRAACQTEGRAARERLQDAGIDPFVAGGEGWRERVAGAFDSYLVTDSDPCEMTAAEMAACWPFDDMEKVFAFSDSRGDYAPPFVRAVLCSGFSWGVGDGGGPLDAPGHMAAGAMRWIDGYGWFPVVCEGPGI